MHYFSGIYRFRGARTVFDSEIKNMLPKVGVSAEQMVFTENNFGLCLERPQCHSPILTVPLFSQSNDGDAVAVFEGRIDNRSELLKKLSDKKLNGDECLSVELILLLYRAYGLEFLSFLEGVYAFIIWDKRKNELILHRDKIGTKPLYYGVKNNSLIFGTFLGSIFNNQLVKKEINFEWLSSYFFMDGLNRGSDTEYKGFKNLMTGYVLVANKSGIRLQPVDYKEKFDLSRFNEEDMVNNFYKVLLNSFKKAFNLSQSISLAFSGGLDTKIILAAAKKYKVPIDTFTVRFKSQSATKQLDYKLARETAKKFRVRHYEFNLFSKKFLEDINEPLKSSGRLINFNNLNSFYIFQWISRHSNLIVSGDGTEEQLSLYPYHLFFNFADRLFESIPEYNIRKLYKPIIETYCDLFFTRSWEWQNMGARKENFFKHCLFTKEAQKEANKYDSSKIFYECLEKSPDTNLYCNRKSPVASLFNKALWIDFTNNFSPKIFTVCDLVSRTNSIEIYLPFVDIDFVSFCSKIPASLKYKPGTLFSKYILRRAAENLIGKKDAYTTFKSGSDIPFNEWLVDPYFEKYVRHTLRSSQIKKYGILNQKYIRQLLNEHYSEKGLFKLVGLVGSVRIFKKGIDHTHKILKLLGFQVWCENNFG